MDIKNVLNIGLQLLDRLETLHNVGLVHKDIKPANICFGIENPEDPGQDKSKILYLIDYGLTKQASEVRARKFREDFLKSENLRLTGTPIYASINSHMGTTQCYKKDDIESFVYMLIHLARGRLPWLYVDVKYGDNYINIFNCKRTIQAKELVGSLPPGFIAMVDYARNMDSIETPDYEFLKKLLLQMAQDCSRCAGMDMSGIPNLDFNSEAINSK